MLNDLPSLLKRYAVIEYDSFSKDRLRYVANLGLGFAKDYWDLGVAVVSGAAFAGLINENLPKIFGEYNLHAGIGFALTSLIGGTNFKITLRPERNIFMGMGSFLFFLGYGNITEQAVVYKAAGVFMGGLSTFFELGRKMETWTKYQSERVALLDKLV